MTMNVQIRQHENRDVNELLLAWDNANRLAYPFLQ